MPKHRGGGARVGAGRGAPRDPRPDGRRPRLHPHHRRGAGRHGPVELWLIDGAGQPGPAATRPARTPTRPARKPPPRCCASSCPRPARRPAHDPFPHLRRDRRGRCRPAMGRAMAALLAVLPALVPRRGGDDGPTAPRARWRWRGICPTRAAASPVDGACRRRRSRGAVPLDLVPARYLSGCSVAALAGGARSGWCATTTCRRI